MSWSTTVYCTLLFTRYVQTYIQSLTCPRRKQFPARNTVSQETRVGRYRWRRQTRRQPRCISPRNARGEDWLPRSWDSHRPASAPAAHSDASRPGTKTCRRPGSHTLSCARTRRRARHMCRVRKFCAAGIHAGDNDTFRPTDAKPYLQIPSERGLCDGDLKSRLVTLYMLIS